MRTLLLTLVLVLPAFAEPEPVLIPGLFDVQNKLDPVDGKKVGKSSADWKGVRVHYSDSKNIATFEEDPKRYVGKLGFALVEMKDKEGKVVRTVLDLQNKNCPIKPTEEASAKVYAEVNGVRIRACCGKCKQGIRRQWEKSGKALGYAWVAPVIDLRNTKCPVTGDECYPSAPIWIDVDGIRIRTCCDHCIEEIRADTARTFRMLGIEPAELKKKLLTKDE